MQPVIPDHLRAWQDIFPAKLTAKSGTNPILYTFTEMIVAPSDGTYTTAVPGRSGSTAREINNRNVDVTSTPTVWMRLRGFSLGQPVWEFCAPPTTVNAIQTDTITTDQNNYALTAVADDLVLTVNSPSSLTGLSGGYDGRTVTITNLDSSTSNLTLAHNSGSSSVGNKFDLPNNVDYVLPPGYSVTLSYNATAGTWFLENPVAVVPIGLPGGQTIIGGTSSGDDLVLKSTSNSTLGTIDLLATSADTNTSRTITQIRHTTSGTAAAGFGGAIAYLLENGSGSEVTAATVGTTYTNTTASSEAADIVFSAMRAGTLSEGMRVISSGAIRLPEISAPSTPASGFGLLYFKSDGNLYFKNDAGSEVTASGGSFYDFSYFRQVGTSPIESWYYGGIINGSGSAGFGSGVTLTANRYYAFPFLSPRGGTLDRIAIRVAGGTSATSVRLGIYSATSVTNLYPSALVLDAGTVSVASTGIKTITISQALTAGTLYWLALVGESTPAVYGPTSIDSLWPIFGGSSGFDAFDGYGLYVDDTYGALASTFPASASVSRYSDYPNQFPIIGVRYSA